MPERRQSVWIKTRDEKRKDEKQKDEDEKNEWQKFLFTTTHEACRAGTEMGYPSAVL